MCNIAGYVGEKDAAPVLTELIRKQEGLFGGFFTGMATHDGARLDYRKIQGELSTLLKETDAASLKGKMGIAHSRTPSGGDSLWSHPFVTEREGDLQICYIANGNGGVLESRIPEAAAVADKLEQDGYPIPCKLSFDNDNYVHLSTGEPIHVSDVMCQLICKYRDESGNTLQAMTRAYTEIGTEIVGLVADRKYPDRIFFSRINMPMFVGFDGSGAYIVSSPLGFPDSVTEYRLMPPLSSGAVYRDHVEVTPYESFCMEALEITSELLDITEDVFVSKAKEMDVGMKDVASLVRDAMPKGFINQAHAMIYIVIMRLLKENRIRQVNTRWTVDGADAPKTRFALV